MPKSAPKPLCGSAASDGVLPAPVTAQPKSDSTMVAELFSGFAATALRVR
jgi:hypothetical protein